MPKRADEPKHPLTRLYDEAKEYVFAYENTDDPDAHVEGLLKAAQDADQYVKQEDEMGLRP